MHFSTSLVAIVATMLAAGVTGQALSTLALPTIPDITIDFATFSIAHTLYPPPKSELLSDLAVKASSQVTKSAFKADVSKIPEAKTANLVSDITKVAAQALWSGTSTSPLPAWLTALPTTGYAYNAINGDIAQVFKSEIDGATPAGSSLKPSITAKAESLESSLEGKASSFTGSIAASLQSSLKSKASSLTSSIGSKISSKVSTATSTGGAHEAQATSGLMAMGAVVGGVVAVAALL